MKGAKRLGVLVVKKWLTRLIFITRPFESVLPTSWTLYEVLGLFSAGVFWEAYAWLEIGLATNLSNRTWAPKNSGGRTQLQEIFKQVPRFPLEGFSNEHDMDFKLAYAHLKSIQMKQGHLFENLLQLGPSSGVFGSSFQVW
jgi:hypothetical protein